MIKNKDKTGIDYKFLGYIFCQNLSYQNQVIQFDMSTTFSALSYSYTHCISVLPNTGPLSRPLCPTPSDRVLASAGRKCVSEASGAPYNQAQGGAPMKTLFQAIYTQESVLWK